MVDIYEKKRKNLYDKDKRKGREDMKRKKVITVLLCITLLGTSSFTGYRIGKINGNTTLQTGNTAVERTVESQGVAVVNLDTGISDGNTQVYYGEQIINFPNDNFIYTSLEDARNGIEEGRYGAYIIIPSDFSENVESLNTVPAASQLQYAVSEDVSADAREELLGDVLQFGEQLNSQMTYMYLCNIMDEFHAAQDESAMVMNNDITDKEAIQGIQASDLVSMVPVPELKQQEDTTIPLDISDYTEENVQLIQAVDSAYRENLSDASAQLSDLRTAGNELVSSLKEISEGVGKINLLSDADGQLLYRDGIRNLQDTLLAYNGEKTAEQNSRLAQIAQIQNVTEQLDTNLQQCIENYNQRIEAAGIQNLNSYGREMKAQLPKLQWKEAEAEDGTVAYELTCSQVEGMEEPPVITIALEQNAIEENVKNKNYIDKILKAFLLPEDSDGGDGEEDKTGEGEKTEEDKNGEEKTGEDKTEEGKTEEGEKNEPESGEGEDTGEEPEAAVTVEKIFEQCDADTEIMEFLTEQGYASTKEFLKAYLDGEVPVAQTETQLKVTGDVDALGEYLKASLEQITTEDYTLPVFEGSWQTGDGSRMGFRDLLRDTGLLCDAMQTDVAAQKNVDVDGITGLVQSGCIQPLADRTDFVKKEIENSQKEEQDAVNSYQRSVNGFHPRQDTTVMNDSVSSMRENAALMQQEINTSNQSYVDYADKLYQTTSENILTLQQHIEEAKETSNQAVTDALASAKEVKNTTSSQNQTALADFAAKLPYTRVGSMEYTQVYEFVAQPTQMLQVSDYQRLKDEVDHTVSQKSVTGSREQQKSSHWVEYLLYGILGILAVGILGSYARSYHRRIKEQSNPSKDVAI